MPHDLSKRVALITGGSRGLGAAIATELGRCGAAVAINTWNHPELAETLAESVGRGGGRASIFRADVRDEAQVRALVEAVQNRFGPIDILVINATGPQPALQIEKLSWQACLDQLEFFVKSPVLLMQAVLGPMKQRRHGRVIHIGSEVFEKGAAGFSNYVSAKGAQIGLMRSWAMELAPWGITVNAVSPGWIPTERHAADPQSMKDAYAKAVPMRRMGVPDDVAAAVAFLASDAANFVTGQNLAVNGGNTLA